MGQTHTSGWITPASSPETFLSQFLAAVGARTNRENLVNPGYEQKFALGRKCCLVGVGEVCTSIRERFIYIGGTCGGVCEFIAKTIAFRLIYEKRQQLKNEEGLAFLLPHCTYDPGGADSYLMQNNKDCRSVKHARWWRTLGVKCHSACYRKCEQILMGPRKMRIITLLTYKQYLTTKTY